MSAASDGFKNIPDFLIRGFTEPDAAAVVNILGKSPEAACWSLESFRRIGVDGLEGWVAEDRGEVVGFLVGRVAADEFEILNLAIFPVHRRKGIASKLLERALETSRQQGCGCAFLEVRASNAAAMQLYRSHGFSECGRRRGYYSHPVEDAVVLSRSAADGF